MMNNKERELKKGHESGDQGKLKEMNTNKAARVEESSTGTAKDEGTLGKMNGETTER